MGISSRSPCQRWRGLRGELPSVQRECAWCKRTHRKGPRMSSRPHGREISEPNLQVVLNRSRSSVLSRRRTPRRMAAATDRLRAARCCAKLSKKRPDQTFSKNYKSTNAFSARVRRATTEWTEQNTTDDHTHANTLDLHSPQKCPLVDNKRNSCVLSQRR